MLEADSPAQAQAQGQAPAEAKAPAQAQAQALTAVCLARATTRPSIPCIRGQALGELAGAGRVAWAGGGRAAEGTDDQSSMAGRQDGRQAGEEEGVGVGVGVKEGKGRGRD